MPHDSISHHQRAEGKELFTAAEIDGITSCYCIDLVEVSSVDDHFEGCLPDCYALFCCSIRRKWS